MIERIDTPPLTETLEDDVAYMLKCIPVNLEIIYEFECSNCMKLPTEVNQLLPNHELISRDEVFRPKQLSTQRVESDIGIFIFQRWESEEIDSSAVETTSITIKGIWEYKPLQKVIVTAKSLEKTAGQSDPNFESTYVLDPNVEGMEPGWYGNLTREPGESPGDYQILQGDLALADGTGGFKAEDWVLECHLGILTIIPEPN